MRRSIFLVSILVILHCETSIAGSSYKDSKYYSSKDLFLKDHSERRDRAFTDYQIVDLGVQLSSSTSCGSINLKASLRGAMNNLLDANYFSSLGSSIISSAPLLAICYASPSWCSLIKNFRLNSSLLSKLNLSKCSLIDSYVDSRAKDWDMAKQECLRGALKRTGGDVEAAMDQCGKNSYKYGLANWAGRQNGGRVKVNRLIESSAKWAGFQGREARRIVDMTKAFVGDSIFAQGKISVDFGGSGKPLSPRLYMLKKQRKIEKALFKITRRIDQSGGATSIGRVVTDDDLLAVSGDGEQVLVDRETLRSIYYLPNAKQKEAIQKLSAALAIRGLAVDINKSIDLLAVLEKNPNLPQHRKDELDLKRRELKENLELTLELHRQKTHPMNVVLSQINETGHRYQTGVVERNMNARSSDINSRRSHQSYFDCSDGFMCEESGGLD